MKGFNLFQCIVWLSVAVVIVNTPNSLYAMEKPLASYQEKKGIIQRLVGTYRETRELRRKKVAGIATPEDLQKLERIMSNVKKGAAVIGMTVAAIVAIAGGVYTYKQYKKHMDEQERSETREQLRQEQKRGEAVRITEEESLESKEARNQQLLLLFARRRVLPEYTEVKELLNLGADPNIVDTSPYSFDPGLLHKAFPDYKLIRLLLKHGATVDNRDPSGDTIFFRLFGEGIKSPEGLADLLLFYGADINKANGPSKETALHGVIPSIRLFGNESRLINFLLGKGANIEARDDMGQTALHRAAERGLTPIVGLLFSRGANIEAKDKSNQTPLHLASLSGEVSTVELLLNKGANIDAKDNQGITPLYEASRSRNPDIVDLLLKRGADPESRDIWGRRLVDLPSDPNVAPLDPEVIRLLRNRARRAGLGALSLELGEEGEMRAKTEEGQSLPYLPPEIRKEIILRTYPLVKPPKR